MAKPLLYNTKSFDKKNSHIFTFSYSGNQVFKNRLIIKNNSTDEVVYDKTITSNKLQHELPANSISVNGVCYNATIQVYDINNTPSEISSPILFYCYTTPSFIFSNVVENQIIRNSSYEFSLSYSQKENELLNEYQIILYDSDKRQLFTTGVLRNYNSLSKIISNLEDNGEYYIRATGQTVHQMDIDTGFIHISCDYEKPAMYSLITLENIYNKGAIKIATNFVLAEFRTSPYPPTYLDSNTTLDLTNGNKAILDSRFVLESDGLIKIRGRKFSNNSILFVAKNKKDKIILEYRKGLFYGENSEKVCFVLKIYNGNLYHQITSGYINTFSDTIYKTITITRKNNIYGLEVV